MSLNKSYPVIEVKGVYTCDEYERIQLKSLSVTFNVKALAN